ncbi:MAG: hypothetical protein K2H97_04025 [Prevotella sp.]|nr:hypothetical protein [Prevotella sp.]
MKYNNVKYGILLSKEQLDFLKDDNQGFHRMKTLDTFLSLAAIEPFRYEKKNFSADLGIGQFAISKVELAELWHCDRKTAQKIIDLFNEVGILTSIANNRTTIHTIHCLAFWFVDGQNAPIKNPNYQRNPIVQNPAVHDNANPMSADDNGNSHPLLFTSSTPVSSVADANGRSSECHPSLLEDGRVVTDEDEVNTDEREENKLSPYGEDGQLPEDHLEQLDEHYANLLPETDEPYRTSNDVALGCTPSMPTNPKGIPDDDGSTNQLVSPTPSTIAEDVTDSAESPLYGGD